MNDLVTRIEERNYITCYFNINEYLSFDEVIEAFYLETRRILFRIFPFDQRKILLREMLEFSNYKSFQKRYQREFIDFLILRNSTSYSLLTEMFVN